NIVRMAIKDYLESASAVPTQDCKNLSPIVSDIQESIVRERIENWERLPTDEQDQRVDEIACLHVQNTIYKVVQKSPTLTQLIEQHRVKIIGGMYDVQTGEVDFFEAHQTGCLPELAQSGA